MTNYTDRLMEIARQIFRLEQELALKRREFANMCKKAKQVPLPVLKFEEREGLHVLVHDKSDHDENVPEG